MALAELEDDLAEAITEIVNEHEAMARSVETLEVPLEKTDIRVAEVKLIWVPTS